MPPSRWLEYDTPPGPPIPRGHSLYGLAASLVALLAMVIVVAIQRHLLPFSLLPLAVPAGVFASFAALFACAAATLDTTAKPAFTWVGAAITGSIPLAAWLASEPMVQWMMSLLPR